MTTTTTRSENRDRGDDDDTFDDIVPYPADCHEEGNDNDGYEMMMTTTTTTATIRTKSIKMTSHLSRKRTPEARRRIG